MEVREGRMGSEVDLPVGAKTERDLLLIRLLRDVARFWRGGGHCCLGRVVWEAAADDRRVVRFWGLMCGEIESGVW
jgi:hypothetical protein